MPKKKSGSHRRGSAEAVAERAKPNWRVVAPIATDRAASADATTPELADLQRKYVGAAPQNKARDRKGKNNAQIVIMEEKNAADVRPGRKAVVVDKAKIIGEQG